MITIPRENLLAALSSFWLNLFSDDKVIENLYNSNINLMGEAYLDLLEGVLSRRLEDVPVFGKRYWQAVSFDIGDLFYDAEFDPAFPYVIELPEELQIVEFNTLTNQVLDPTLTFDRNVDFIIRLERVPNSIRYRTYVHFAEDPLANLEEGESFANSARVWTDIEPRVLKQGLGETNPPNILDSQDIFDPLDVHRKLSILEGDDDGVYPIEGQTVDTLEVDGELSAATNVLWQVITPEKSWRFVFWAPNVSVDKKILAEQYGALIARFEPSSEDYKEFLKGIFNFFANGPDVARLEAALNVMIGYPIIRENGEVFVEFEQDTTENTDTVRTNKHEYTLPLGETKESIQTATPGELTFVAFESLSDKFLVFDAVDNPTWWHGLRVPLRFMPGETVHRRVSAPQLYPLLCGPDYNEADFRCGDLGLRCGADSNGFIPDLASRDPLAFKHSFVLMETLLSNHMFGVVTDGIEALPRAEADLVDIIIAGKPAHTYMWYEPQVELEDEFTVQDYDVELELELSLEEHCPTLSSTLYCGEPGFQVQQCFTYEDHPNYIEIHDETDGDLEAGVVPLVCGGASPFRLPGYTSSTTNGISDWPASIQLTSVP